MNINELVFKLKQSHILVVGDAMLDKYWFGDTNRISPDAPVPVVNIMRTEERLGGAANVARNISKIGVNSTLLSVVGDDIDGKTLEQLLISEGVHSKLIFSSNQKTTIKLRIIARQQHLLRCDFESFISLAELTQSIVLFENLLNNKDIVIFSDYGKGVLSKIQTMINIAKAKDIPILIDPKGSNYDRYRGATLITPNKTELRQVVGSWSNECTLTEKAQNLRTHLNLKYLLLTRSEEGMTLYSSNGQLDIPAQAREVYDVSGAGDTVIGILASMLSTGLSVPEAVQIANHAAGIVVGKLGTASVTFEELFRE